MATIRPALRTATILLGLATLALSAVIARQPRTAAHAALATMVSTTRYVVAVAQPAVRYVVATAYARGDGHEWRDGSVVYAGGRPWVGTVALGPNLVSTFPLGTCVAVRGYRYRVRDLMATGVRGARIDIYEPSVWRALRWGRQVVRVSAAACSRTAPRRSGTL